MITTINSLGGGDLKFYIRNNYDLLPLLEDRPHNQATMPGVRQKHNSSQR
jgi:hypothetical protein